MNSVLAKIAEKNRQSHNFAVRKKSTDLEKMDRSVSGKPSTAAYKSQFKWNDEPGLSTFDERSKSPITSNMIINQESGRSGKDKLPKSRADPRRSMFAAADTSYEYEN